jgi:hypothetical protein
MNKLWMEVERMNIFEAFEQMSKGETVVLDGVMYKNEKGKLVESYNQGKSWQETEEFKFGTINGEWELYNGK